MHDQEINPYIYQEVWTAISAAPAERFRKGTAMLDLLISNVMLTDTDTGTETLASVGIVSGRIAGIFPHMVPPRLPDARETIDAEGAFLFPGFVDFHTHLFRCGSSFGMDADRLLEGGVTAAADMGSAGRVNFPAMYLCDLQGKKPHLYAYLNISPVGQPGRGIFEPLGEALMEPDEIRRLLAEYPGVIRGLKVRLSRNIVGALGTAPLKTAVALGEQFGLRVCVHTTDPPVPMDQVAAMLRPGDILSHTYHGCGHHAAENAAVLDGLLRAKERGVLMEVGNGSKNFSFAVAEECLSAGLTPDIISSDSTPSVFHKGTAMWDLPRVVQKFINMGLPAADAFRSVTETPACVLGLDGRIGKIAPGYDADLCLFRKSEEIISYTDSGDTVRKGPEGLIPFRTFLNGRTVWQADRD